MKCKKCYTEMIDSKAIVNGYEGFIRENILIDCKKCPNCGHSVSIDGKYIPRPENIGII